MIAKSRMKQSIAAMLIFFFILLINSPMASADSWPQPEPFSVLSEDGARIFHVTPDSDWGQTEIDDWADFPPTGLYYNTDPLTLIYLVENPGWALWEQDFIFSQDMQYFVWVPQMNAVQHNFQTSDATALVFFANGSVQKTYMVSDLVQNADAVSFSVTTARWTDRNVEFDPATNRLALATVDGISYQFDITSGAIVRHTEFPFEFSWFQLAIFFALGVTVFSGGIIVLITRRRRTE